MRSLCDRLSSSGKPFFDLIGGGQSDSAAGKALGSFDHIFVEGEEADNDIGVNRHHEKPPVRLGEWRPPFLAMTWPRPCSKDIPRLPR